MPEVRPTDEQVRADRLASLRTLAAGLANEINSPLTNVLANLEHVVRRLRVLAAHEDDEEADLAEELPPLVEALSRAVDAAGRVRQLTKDLMIFSRSGVERRQLVDVRSVVQSAIHLAEPEIRARAQLITTFGDVPSIEADESRLAQALVAILVNASQSIPEGDPKRHEVRIATGTDAQGNALVEVADTGAGISPDVIERVFDPFFTTRPARGLGLGLSIAHGTVSGLGGKMTVESEVGEGSVVRVTLPTAPSQKNEPLRVLILVDEPVTGEALARVLGSGHRTVVAADGAAALVRLDSESYDAIVCDAQLPDMETVDFYAEAVRRQPRLAERIVFLTGGAMTKRAQAFLASVGPRCLEKPPDVDRLRDLLRRGLRPLR